MKLEIASANSNHLRDGTGLRSQFLNVLQQCTLISEETQWDAKEHECALLLHR